MTVDAELLQVLEQLPDLVHIRFAVNGGVGEDLEPALLGGLDSFNGHFKDAFALDGQVVVFLHAVQVNVENQTRVGRKFFQFFGEEHPVGAELDISAAIQDALDQGAYFGVEQRLATADGNHGGSALVDSAQALLERQALANAGFVLPDAAAARTGKVAGVQRLQHHHKREA